MKISRRHFPLFPDNPIPFVTRIRQLCRKASFRLKMQNHALKFCRKASFCSKMQNIKSYSELCIKYILSAKYTLYIKQCCPIDDFSSASQCCFFPFLRYLLCLADYTPMMLTPGLARQLLFCIKRRQKDLQLSCHMTKQVV